jgi:hypothetical protein
MTRKICFLLVIAPLLPGLFVSCDQQPKAKPLESADAQKPKKKSLGSPDTRFAEERTEMINGKFAEAADAFAETETIPKIREPLLSWIEFHHGMALLLTGKEAEARTVFGQIEDRGPYTKNGADSQVADFLVKLAHLLRGADPVPGSVSKDYDKWSYQGIAFLALALKDWNLDKFDDATALFRQFNDVSPDKLVEWADGPEDLRKLKEIADIRAGQAGARCGRGQTDRRTARRRRNGPGRAEEHEADHKAQQITGCNPGRSRAKGRLRDGRKGQIHSGRTGGR